MKTTTQFNTEPKNEIELRLTCVDMAMSMTPTNPARSSNETIGNADKIFSFVTTNAGVDIENVGGVIDSIIPAIMGLIPTMAGVIDGIEQTTTEKPKKVKSEKTE